MLGITITYNKTTCCRDKTMKQAKLLTDAERKRLAAVIDSKRYATRNHTAVALSFYAGLTLHKCMCHLVQLHSAKIR